jgi:hypothetical protein
MRRRKASGDPPTESAEAKPPAEERTKPLFPTAETPVPKNAEREGSKVHCRTCDAELTWTSVSGWMFGCGHHDGAKPNGERPGHHPARDEAPPPPKAKDPPRPGDLAYGSAEGDEVRVVWGNELFSPKQFHTFTVGPFELTTKVRRGETPAQAMARATAQLAEFAQAEHERKRTIYLRNVAEAIGAVKRLET